MTAATFVFAWEFGGGLGHASRIKPLAQELLHTLADATPAPDGSDDAPPDSDGGPGGS